MSKQLRITVVRPDGTKVWTASYAESGIAVLAITDRGLFCNGTEEPIVGPVFIRIEHG